MITAAQQSQLSTWLTQGTFANIFSHTPGDGKLIADFLQATSGAGPTFVLLAVSGSAYGVNSNLPAQIIGGYNPQNWLAGGNQTSANYQRTAFIFNLTAGTLRRQNLIGQGAADSGLYQTNAAAGAIGIMFGKQAGDIMVSSDLNQGWAENQSYGGTTGGPAITTGGAIIVSPPRDTFQVTQLDVYAFAPSGTPAGIAAPSHAKVSISAK